MTSRHPITPPPELVQQWMDDLYDEPGQFVSSVDKALATRAAQWGADQELEACCKLLELSYEWDISACEDLRASRRSPASLKEQGLQALEALQQRTTDPSIIGPLRLALEALPDD